MSSIRPSSVKKYLSPILSDHIVLIENLLSSQTTDQWLCSHIPTSICCLSEQIPTALQKALMHHWTMPASVLAKFFSYSFLISFFISNSIPVSLFIGTPVSGHCCNLIDVDNIPFCFSLCTVCSRNVSRKDMATFLASKILVC